MRKMIPETATDFILGNQTIKDVSISGVINISTDTLKHDLTIERCFINSFDGSWTTFERSVKFIDCKFKECNFFKAYFLGGLEIINCSFSNFLNFESGGHNRYLSPLKIESSIFNGFVNFFDCLYEGPFILKDNDFRSGTNILGNIGMPYKVSFINGPVFQNNKGILDVNGEGVDV